MEQTGTNYDNALVEHTLAYLRECHAHLHSLARVVVSLNVAVMAFGVLFLRLSDGFKPISSNYLGGVLVIFGILIALFGVVFNQGAQKALLHLVQVIDDSKEFLKSAVDSSEISVLFFQKVLNTARGRVFHLTNVFFALCSFIWIFYGGVLIAYGGYTFVCNQG